ncbi:Protein SODIUM POTASSIUM ROOT DEFECTIVE 1, partial [Cucurbita argyrosperma subsp. argyrosperma]
MANLQIVPAHTPFHVEPQLVEMMVPLYSHGCANKIHKALSHLKGIYSVNVDYEEQKVTVWGICNKNQVLSTVRSKRKAARFWNNNDDDDNNNNDPQAEEEGLNSRRPSFGVNKLRSLSFKLACKKVFTTTRSYSLRIFGAPTVS